MKLAKKTKKEIEIYFAAWTKFKVLIGNFLVTYPIFLNVLSFLQVLLCSCASNICSLHDFATKFTLTNSKPD